MADINIREPSFPVIPDDAPESIKDYLRQLELMLKYELKGSEYMNAVIEDGVIGN